MNGPPFYINPFNKYVLWRWVWGFYLVLDVEPRMVRARLTSEFVSFSGLH